MKPQQATKSSQKQSDQFGPQQIQLPSGKQQKKRKHKSKKSVCASEKPSQSVVDACGGEISQIELDRAILASDQGDELKKSQDKADCQKEMSKLMQIEQIFFRKQTTIDRQGGRENGTGNTINMEFLRVETADFPMKLVTHALIEESKDSQNGFGDPDSQNPDLVIQRNGAQGTPRFPTGEEIEAEERRLLLSFAFKDADEIEKYRKEMNYMISQEFIVERPPESRYRELKHQLRRFEPSNKKTLVFCGIDGLFMFSTQAQIVKTCDRQVKIRKDGIKRRYKIFFRPHLYTFLKTLSQYFELVLYLSEEERVASQWVSVLNSFNDESRLKSQASQNYDKPIASSGVAEKQQNGLKLMIKRKQTITEKFFDIILTREHCIVDKQVKCAIRNKDLLLEGRTIKNLIFIGTDLKDAMLIKENAIILRPYHGNKYENTLAKLKIYLLKYILECNDVREVIRKDFLCHLKAPILQHQIEAAVAQQVNKKVIQKKKESDNMLGAAGASGSQQLTQNSGAASQSQAKRERKQSNAV